MPTIEHAMRDAPTRANPVLSLIFSIVPVAAVLIFMATVAYIQSKSTTPAATFGAIELGFLVCCLSLLAMTTSFWLGLTLFSFYSTIKYLCVLAPVTAFFATKLASQ